MENSVENRKLLVNNLASFYQRLSAVVNKVDNKMLDYKSAPNSWSIRNIVHHIADAQMNIYIRVKLVLTEDNPVFKTFEETEWAKLADFNSPVQPAMTLIMGLYSKWADVMYSIIERDDTWERIGIHPDNGEITLFELMQTYVKHGDNHIEQIQGILDNR